MKAKVTYLLSEAGRRASLVAGGSGLESQSVEIEINPQEIDLFDLVGDGSLSADGTQGSRIRPWSSSCPWESHYFDTVPTPSDLIEFLRTRRHLREDALARCKAEKELKQQQEAEAAAVQRQKAIADLRASPGDSRTVTRYGDNSVYANGVPLYTTDADCGGDVQAWIARDDAANLIKEKQAQALAKMRAIAPVVDIRPATLNAAGLYEFQVPDPEGDKNWAKHVESIDPTASDGYAFVGPWLRCGATEALPAGELVLVGSSSWQGSRKRGKLVLSKSLYMVTPAGLRHLKSDDACKSAAIDYLALTSGERIAKALKICARNAAKYINQFDELSASVEDAKVKAEIAERRDSWSHLLDACKKVLEAQPVDERITDLDSAAAAIVTAGFRVLSKQYHPDAGGSAETMALLTQARAQLRELLQLALTGTK